MNMIKKSVEKKQEKTKEDIRMLETFQGKDRTSKEAIKQLIQLVNEETLWEEYSMEWKKEWKKE